MEPTRDDFEHWLFAMDDRLEQLPDFLPIDISTKMDYSPSSLSILEKWLLNQYDGVKKILENSEKQRLDVLGCYVGETLRKKLAGIWDIDLKDKKNAYYQIPVIKKQGCWTECPMTLVTAATDRRTGEYMIGVLNAIESQYPIG